MTDRELRQLLADLPPAVTALLCPGQKVVVTGCAGFIGSHLTEALLALGCRVTGVDSLTDYYDPAQKREHLAGFIGHERFTFQQEDLLAIDPDVLLDGTAACFHLAAQAGVRASWGSYFRQYLDWNVMATQRLLEACKQPAIASSLQRFVYSSSSSVYGDQEDLPVTERALPQPRSPYGVTKLAAEHLCVLYTDNFGVPTASLRYFTVYGPRQRPDMAFRRFIETALDGAAFHVFGDGRQTRDFTYVADAVGANLRAVVAPQPGAVFNVGGGSRVSLRDALDELVQLLATEATAVRPELIYEPVVEGDVRDTFADRSRVEELIGYRPTVPLADGLARQVRWVVQRRRAGD